MVAQVAGDVERTRTPISTHDPCMCSQTKVPWSHSDLSVVGPIQGTSCPIMVDSYSKWSRLVRLKSAATGTIINSLCGVFTAHGMPTVIVSRNVVQFSSSSTPFESTFHGLNISVLHSPPNLNCLDDQPVKNMRRQLLVSQGRVAGEESLNSWQLMYRTTSHVGVQIWVRHRKHRRSRYTSVSSEPEPDATQIYLDACDLSPQWNLETPKIQCSNRSDIYFWRLRRPRKWLKAHSKLKGMDKQLSLEGVG